MAACYKCNGPVTMDFEGPVPVDAVCPQCSSWVHACANCAFYDEYSQTKCREPKAEFVFDRVGKNVCAFFKLKATAKEREDQQKKKRVSPRMEQREKESRARDNLSRLFRI